MAESIGVSLGSFLGTLSALGKPISVVGALKSAVSCPTSATFAIVEVSLRGNNTSNTLSYQAHGYYMIQKGASILIPLTYMSSEKLYYDNDILVWSSNTLSLSIYNAFPHSITAMFY